MCTSSRVRTGAGNWPSALRRSWAARCGPSNFRAPAAGVFIFTGGLDDAAPVFSVDGSSGTPLFTDGPFIESKEHLGGFAVVDVADEEAARLWAGKIAVACGWPQEVRRFRVPMQLPGTS